MRRLPSSASRCQPVSVKRLLLVITRTGAVEQSGQLTFRPCNTVTRGQTAKFLTNTFSPDCQVP